MYSGSKRNRCFIISAREKPFLSLNENSFYSPDIEPDNETWMRISPQGLILYATASSSLFFQQDVSVIVGSSLSQWMDHSDGFILEKVLASSQDESISFLISVQGFTSTFLFRFLQIGDVLGGTRWVQIKRKAATVNPVLIPTSEKNLYSVIQSVRSSSIYYECNKIRVQNSKLTEEISKLLVL